MSREIFDIFKNNERFLIFAKKKGDDLLLLNKTIKRILRSILLQTKELSTGLIKPAREGTLTFSSSPKKFYFLSKMQLTLPQK